MSFGSHPGRILKKYEDEETAPICYGYNCDCEKHATMQIQGETDSFGYETLEFCNDCYQKMIADGEAHREDVLQEEHELAPEGMTWLFTATRQDDTDWYASSYKDRAQCVLAKERAENDAAAHCGLYVPKIRLVTIEEARRVISDHLNRWEDEFDDDDDFEMEDDDL